jgi:hypothetical protein
MEVNSVMSVFFQGDIARVNRFIRDVATLSARDGRRQMAARMSVASNLVQRVAVPPSDDEINCLALTVTTANARPRRWIVKTSQVEFMCAV